MDPLTAAVTVTQSAGYCMSLLSALLHVCDVLRNSSETLEEYRSNIDDLITIVNAVKERSSTCQSEPLQKCLVAIAAASYRLLKLLRGPSRLKVTFTLLFRREQINDNFTSLERRKTTLLLHINADTFLVLEEMKWFTKTLSKGKSKETTSTGAMVDALSPLFRWSLIADKSPKELSASLDSAIDLRDTSASSSSSHAASPHELERNTPTSQVIPFQNVGRNEGRGGDQRGYTRHPTANFASFSACGNTVGEDGSLTISSDDANSRIENNNVVARGWMMLGNVQQAEQGINAAASLQKERNEALRLQTSLKA